MGSVSVSSCRRCRHVSCVHPVAVLNAAFCMICSLSILVEDAIGDHTEEAYFRAGLTTALQVAIVRFPIGLDFPFMTLPFQSVNEEYWSNVFRPDALPDVNHMRWMQY